MYDGANPGIAPRTYALDEVRALPLEQQNEVLGANRGFGGEKIPAPQASLMAVVARGIMERRDGVDPAPGGSPHGDSPSS